MNAMPRFHLIDPSRDPWRRADPHDPAPAPRAGLLLRAEQWRAVRAHWPAELPVGVLWPNDQPLDALRRDLPRLELVALNFPIWTDGRAYSQARLLRARHGFGGQIRAVGDILADQVLQLWRCGFDAAELRPGQSAAVAQQALRWFAAFAQPDVRHLRVSGRP
ncbi:hypothetical protein Talka_00559 [Tepidimonas alkaliphilus]|uniref:Oxidoreductase n=1 Tax=Tepidimonas alkaliphilus TaxID=2588942 RepID=A0A554WBF4_9BURK|nr:DUF934 domain-containing protein [Tepidimonas alkaliphilus]TSE20896.1 hypothetical protein Talka_00559 [Tepidimonas alkaliphilus]